MPRGEKQNRIAIHHSPVGITEKRAVRVAIESYSQVELSRLGCDRFRQFFRMQSATVVIDILTVRRRTEARRLDAA